MTIFFLSRLPQHSCALTGSKSVRQIFVEATSAEDMTAAQAEITSLLRKSHGLAATAGDDFSVSNQSDILETMEEVAQTMTLLLGGIAAISLVVGGIGIMNIMLVSVTERTREIGIKKRSGLRNRIFYCSS
jgi:putative ABC transport system permease protein